MCWIPLFEGAAGSFEMRITPTPDGFPAHLFAVQLDEMGQRVRIASTAGSIEGLFAYHVLHEFPHSPATTDVNCAKAGVGSARTGRGSTTIQLSRPSATRSTTSAAERRRRRGMGLRTAWLAFDNVIPSLLRIAFAYQPGTFLGIVLGALASITRGVTAADWLLELLHDPETRTRVTTFMASSTTTSNTSSRGTRRPEGCATTNLHPTSLF